MNKPSRFWVVHRDSEIGQAIRRGESVDSVGPSYDTNDTFSTLVAAQDRTRGYPELLIVEIERTKKSDHRGIMYWKVSG